MNLTLAREPLDEAALIEIARSIPVTAETQPITDRQLAAITVGLHNPNLILSALEQFTAEARWEMWMSGELAFGTSLRGPAGTKRSLPDREMFEFFGLSHLLPKRPPVTSAGKNRRHR